MTQKPHHRQEPYKRPHNYEFQAEDERGWAGQHGQHPATKEEENYQPDQPDKAKAVRPNE